jgi:hypothetical protein
MGVTWLDTPVDISPGTTGSFQNVDISSYVAVGAEIAILKAVNTGASAYQFGYVEDSSVLTRKARISAGVVTMGFCGIASDRSIDIWIGNAAVDVYLIGYFDSASAVCTESATALSHSLSNATWGDVDIGVDNSAIGAIIEVWTDDGANTDLGYRPDGTTYAPTGSVAYGRCFIVKVTNDIFDCYLEDTAVMSVFLRGYITAGVTFESTPAERTVADVGDWYDLSSNLPAGATGGFYDIVSTDSGQTFGMRADGNTSDTLTAKSAKHNFYATKAALQVVEGNISSTAQKFYLVASIDGASSTPKTGSDSLLPKITDTSSLSTALSGSDSALPKITESSVLATAISASDSLLVKTDQTSALNYDVAVSDSVLPKIAESSALAQFNAISASDTLTIAISESAVLATELTATDTVLPKVTDTSGMTVDYASSDTVLIKTAESSSLAVDLTTTDSLLIVLSESSSVIMGVIDKTASDSLLIKTTESISLDVARAPPDTITITLTESGSLSTEISASDSLLLQVSESASEQIAVSVTDSLLLKVTDTAATEVQKAGADSLLITLGESASVTTESGNSVSVSDSLTVKITDSSGLFIADIDLLATAITPLEVTAMTTLAAQAITPLEATFKGDI